MQMGAEEQRQAFAWWLRTGRWPRAETGSGIELKFNPYHDPRTGQFTFAGDGAGAGHFQRRWGSGKFSGGGGGDFGGAGATSTEPWGPPTRKSRPTPPHDATVTIVPANHSAVSRQAPGQPPRSPTATVRTIVRNGYTYQIDPKDRTRRVTGMLTLAETPLRSRTAQARAGGAERRASDDGGHYIAARFNGPTEAFNHFAQDANFNRGGYRRLESDWATAKRGGKQVSVKIVPRFDGGSARPAAIDVRG